MSDPLAGIDQIPWSELEHATGAAGEVSGWLSDLRSGDMDARANGRSRLSSSLHHEGILYDSTAAAVPFLVAIAAAPSTLERQWVVRFLADLAVVRPLDLQWAGLNLMVPTMARYFQGEGSEPFRRSYEAVEEALPTLLGLLADDVVEVRVAAAFTVSFFSRHASIVEAALRGALEREKHSAAIASMLLALAVQDGYLGEARNQELLRDHVESELPLGVVAAAALCYGSGPGHGAAPDALPVLRRALLADPPLDHWSALPWHDGDIVQMALQGVFKQASRVDGLPETKQTAMEIYFDLMERADEEAPQRIIELALAAMRPLFSLVTPEPPPAQGWSPDTLPPNLRRFAEAVARRPFLCGGGLLSALGQNGLPDDLEPLRRFLGVRIKSPLDADLVVGGQSRSARDWLHEPELGDRFIAVAGRHPDAIMIAFAYECGHTDTIQPSPVDDMTFSLMPNEVVKQPHSVGQQIADAAVAHDRDQSLRVATELASERAVKGPPVSYGKITQLHPRAMTLLARIAAAAYRAGAPLPDPIFDVMTEAQLGTESAWEDLSDYYSVLPADRLVHFIAALAGRSWRTSWGDPSGVRIAELLPKLLELIPEDSRADLTAALQLLDAT